MTTNHQAEAERLDAQIKVDSITKGYQRIQFEGCESIVVSPEHLAELLEAKELHDFYKAECEHAKDQRDTLRSKLSQMQDVSNDRDNLHAMYEAEKKKVEHLSAELFKLEKITDGFVELLLETRRTSQVRIPMSWYGHRDQLIAAHTQYLADKEKGNG